MIDRNIRGRDQQRLRVSQLLEAVPSVVVTHPGGSNASKRHRLDEQVDVDLIYRASAEGELARKSIDCGLLAAEDKGCQRLWLRSDSGECLVQRAIGQDRQ